MYKPGVNRWWAFGLIWMVLLTACSAGPSGTPTPASEPVKLQLQWVTQAQFAGYYVALAQGWYAEEGIDLTIIPGGPDLSSMDLVVGRGADFGTALLSDLIVGIQSGKPLVSVAQIQQQNGLLLLARKSSGINSPADFKGKRIGVWLGGWEAQFDALMAQMQLTPNDYELAPQGYSMEAFLSGDLDVASAMIYNEYHVVLESGVPADSLNLIDYADYGLDFPGDTLFVRRDLVEQRPDLCARMLRATLRGWQYAVEHPEEAVDMVLQYDLSGVQTREHQLAMMQEMAKLVQVSVRPLGYTDRGDVLRTVEALATYGILPERIEPDQVFTTAIWDAAQKPRE